MSSATGDKLMRSKDVTPRKLVEAARRDSQSDCPGTEHSDIPQWLNGETDKYKITKKTLGVGTFSTVRLGLINDDPSQRVAIKIVNKKTLDTSKRVSALRREIEILFRLGDHPAIVHLIEVMEDTENVYLIFEEHLGDLHSYIVQQGGRMTESEVLAMFPQILSAVQFCHQNGVVHRDLKLENILYTYSPSTSTSPSDLKVFLADFGFATSYDKSKINSADFKKLTKWCGSPFTVAPEIISRTPYMPEPVDVWSLGSMLFTMLCGFPPFKAKTITRVFKRTQKGKMRAFPRHVSPFAKDLIRRMLVVNPEKRMKIEELSEHPWFSASKKCRKSRKNSAEDMDQAPENTGSTESKKCRSMIVCGLSNAGGWLVRGQSKPIVQAK